MVPSSQIYDGGRKDRGFGKAGMAQGKGKTPDGCWICGSTGHYSRQCPDRYAPGKGKSAHFHYTEEDQWAYAAAMAAAFMKGKGKGKHHGKNAAMAEDAMYFFRGKSQGKGKPMGKNYGTVNAYSMDYVGLHGLEIDEEANMDMQISVVDHGKSLKELAATTKKSMRQPTPSGGMGMLDSGAICSAGPEASIKRLVAAVLDRDHQAAIVVDAQKRPRFRYGSGKWGKALYQVRISSSLSSCSFYADALPDPEESKEPWFEVTTMLVPVLVGMDFFTSNGMIIDFNDGYAVCASQEQARPFVLPKNEKGHLMVDLVDFITQGDLCDHGHPQIQVLVGEDVDLGLQSFWLHEFGESGFLHNCTVLFAHEVEEDVKPRKSKPSSLFNEVWTRRQQLTQQHGLMGNLSSKLSFTTPSSSSSKHVDRENQSRGIGSKPCSDSRSSGPSCEGGSMALLGKAQCSKGSEQQMGSVDPLRKVRFEDGIHPHEGGTGQHNTLPNPSMVQMALDELHRELPPQVLPDAALVKIALDKVTAKERMKTYLEEYRKKMALAQQKVDKMKQEITVAKTATTSGAGLSASAGYPQPRTTSPPPKSTSTSASWEAVSPPKQEAQMMDFLTPEEKDRLMALVQSRMTASQQRQANR